jgi:hypothetical protein
MAKLVTQDRNYLGWGSTSFTALDQKINCTLGSGIVINYLEFKDKPGIYIGLGTKVRLKEDFSSMPAGSLGIIIGICESAGNETNFKYHISLRIRDINSPKIYSADPNGIEPVDDIYDCTL